MKITEAAQRNHEELFPNHQSTLKLTDPELIEIFDNFAFDEALAESKLDTKTRVMMILASLIACQAVSEYKIMAGAALNVGISPVQLKEILYQAVPYVGMARAFDFLHATNEVLTNRGISLPLEVFAQAISIGMVPNSLPKEILCVTTMSWLSPVSCRRLSTFQRRPMI